MTLLRDIAEIDLAEPLFLAASPTADDWLYSLWGTVPGASSPRSHRGTVHPACAASTAWLEQLWGYSASCR